MEADLLPEAEMPAEPTGLSGLSWRRYKAAEASYREWKATDPGRGIAADRLRQAIRDLQAEYAPLADGQRPTTESGFYTCRARK